MMIVWTKIGAGQHLFDAIRSNLTKQGIDASPGSAGYALADHYYAFMANDSQSVATAKAWYDAHYDRVAAGNFGSLDQGLVAATGYSTSSASTSTSAPKSKSKKRTLHGDQGTATVTHSGARSDGLPSLPGLGARGAPAAPSSALPLALGALVLGGGLFWFWSRR